MRRISISPTLWRQKGGGRERREVAGGTPLGLAILASWFIALFEYCFQVPANRIGSAQFSTAQLKTIQEVVTLVVFSAFSVLSLKEELHWNYLAGFFFMGLAVFFVFREW